LETHQNLEPSHSAEVNEITKSLISAQSEIRSLSKDANGYGYKYLSLSVLMDYALPIISKHGLALSQFEDGSGNLVTMLLHESGQFIKGKSTLIDPDRIEMKGVNIEQKRGSILSYEKRYALQAILGITTNEDDNDCSPKGMDKPKTSSNFKKKAETKASPAKKATPKEEAKKPNFRRKKKEAAASAGGL